MASNEEREQLLASFGQQERLLAGRKRVFDSEGFFWEAEDWNEDVALSLAEVESLFPQGIRLGARRLAGLPNPKTC